jgi:hypothetical protein
MSQNNEINLSEEQIRTLRSMNSYWQEIIKRDFAEDYCSRELNQPLRVIGARNILLIIGEYVENLKQDP